MGTIALSDITINGIQAEVFLASPYASAAIVLTRYADVSNVSFSNIILNSIGSRGIHLGTITTPFHLGTITMNGAYSIADIYLGFQSFPVEC